MLGSAGQVAPGHTRASTAWGHEDDQGTAASVTCGEAGRAGTVQAGEEKAHGILPMCINT